MAEKKKDDTPMRVVVDPRVSEDIAALNAEAQEAFAKMFELMMAAAAESTNSEEFEAKLKAAAEAAGMEEFQINKGDDIDVSDDEMQIAMDRRDNPVSRH